MRFALPFFDDSTLIFAARTQKLLVNAGFDASTVYEQETSETLSARQISAHLPGGPDITSKGNMSDEAAAAFEAVVVSKSTAYLREKLADGATRESRNRPAYVAFQPGIEFTPEKGMNNRKNFDAIFFNSEDHKSLYEAKFSSRSKTQTIAVGHPYFLASDTKSTGSDVVFFAQAISPNTFESRRFVLDVLITIAQANPNRRVILKLRHLRSENTTHVHREMFDYQTILEDCFDVIPPNFALNADSLASVLRTAGICITCTSTAAMDATARNIPTMIYLDYPENYKDPLAPLMRAEFRESGLIATLPQVLHLAPRPPRNEWYRQHFRSESELITELVRAVEAFRNS